MRKIIAISLVAVLAGSFLAAIGYSAAHASCGPDLIFVGARGSGEDPQAPSDDYSSGTHGLGGTLGPVASTLQTIVEDDGLTFASYGVHYPAVQVNFDTVSGKLYGTNSIYDDSVTAGGDDMKSYIDAAHAECATTRFILGGYSQGVQAIAAGMAQLTSDEKSLVVASVFFGDPQFNSNDTASDYDSYLTGFNGFYGPRSDWSDLISSGLLSVWLTPSL